MNETRDKRPPAATDGMPARAISKDSSVTPPGIEASSVPQPNDGAGDEVPRSERSSLVGQVIADRYEIQRELGSGGMGTVFYAEHVHMRKPVAVKVLHRELMALPEIVARFEREAIAAGRINDAHVVAATDFGRLDDGSFYLALEYVQGTGLAEVITEGPLSGVRALKITRQILKALSAAHAAGVVHRDLKPENVMLVKRAEEPDFVKVLDFGIAKIGIDEKEELPGGALTRMGSIFGTPQYMAPEQAAGQAVDSRADLYTVGIILYEMLSGKVPFTADEVGRVLAMHLTQPVPPLPEDVDPRVADFVMALLEKHPDERLQTAEEAIQRLDQVLGGLGVSHPSFAMFSLDELGSSAEEQRKTRPGPQVASSRSRMPLLIGALLAIVVVVPLAVVGTLRLAPSGAAPSGSVSAEPSARGARSAELDPDLEALMARAARGDKDALKKLESRSAEERSAPEWVALAQGRMATGKLREGIEAYDRALTADPSLAVDRSLLAQVREAAKDEDAMKAALHFAANRLGSDGADLLYDVWVATRAKTERTKLAKKLVYEGAVREQASPALAVALDLREAEECDEYRELLPRATLHGDKRAARVLRQLTVRVGCGERDREDCYECLRDEEQETALQDAIASAANRSPPRFIP